MRAILGASIVVLIAGSATNAQIESFWGDADGFGTLGAPVDVDGALWRDDFGGSFFTDYREADDLATAPETDIWDAPVSPSWSHVYDATGATSANLHLYIAGFADIGAVDFFVDGSLLTTFDFPGQFQTTHVLDVAVPLSFIDGDTSFTLGTNGSDGYIIDYARLDVVPAPASAALLGLGGLAAIRRRR